MYDVKYTDKAGNSAIKNTYIYVQQGLLLHYDAVDNMGTGHSMETMKWKDLTGNGYDLTLVGFDATQGSGWQDECLRFDGLNDYAKTERSVDYRNTKRLTIQFTDLNKKLWENTKTVLPLESSSNANKNDGAWFIDYNQYNRDTISMVYHDNNLNYNVETATEISKDNQKVNTYTIIIDTMKEENPFMEMYINDQKKTLILHDTHQKDISNKIIQDYQLFLGAREGKTNWTKMDLANVKIYTRALTQEEIQINAQINQYRFDNS